ncbi:MAG: J domain-containing protein [Deltaproteobacteria bacterium]|nr:J domain-containing protein [Deltaproteobacteria bacterium]
MEFIDYYAELGVPRTASQEEISKAFKKAARKYHPDVNKEPGAEAKFKRIAEANEVLKDPEKRKKYDQYGSAWKNMQNGAPPRPGSRGARGGPDFEELLRNMRAQQQQQRRRGAPDGFAGGGGGFGGSGFSDFFEAIFGQKASPFSGGYGVDEEPIVRGQSVEATLRLSLEEAATGGAREITLSDPASGRGKSYQVKIPEGVKSGQKIRLKGQGSPGLGGAEAGDLLLAIQLEPHPRFRLEGSDLYTSLPVSPWVAALGGEAKLRTLGGQVTISVPAGSSTGRRIRLRGKGFPTGKGEAGDLYAEVKIEVPKKLSAEEKELFEGLAKASSFDPSESD